MSYDRAALELWSQQAGEATCETFSNPKLKEIRVISIAKVPSTVPAEVRITWEAVMKDGSVHPWTVEFDVEENDIDDMGGSTFCMLAGSRLFGCLAGNLHK